MNDFTKEELKKLKSGLTGWMELSGVAVQPLIEKLQSMIDNYCESKCFKCKYCGRLRSSLEPNLSCCGDYEDDNQ